MKEEIWALGLHILAYDIIDISKYARELSAKVSNLGGLLKNSDIIIVHVPLNEETKNLIDKKEFDLMKEQRSLLIHLLEEALLMRTSYYNALKSGKIATAGIDVYSEESSRSELMKELISLENAVATPHIGATTYETMKANTMIIVDKIIRFFKKN